MSDVPDSVVPTTRTYESVLEVADDKNIDISFTYPGDVYEICGGTMTVLGPVEDFTDLNDESLVIRFDYGENSFVFTGDQEIPAEEALLATDPDLDADVLKMGHHGSSTSTCPAFWEAVSPEIAVIQCGVDNDYGHPHREIRALLNESGIDWYRTDEQGSIIITGDGSKLTVETVGKVVTD